MAPNFIITFFLFCAFACRMCASGIAHAETSDSTELSIPPAVATKIEVVFEPHKLEKVHRYHKLAFVLRDVYDNSEETITSSMESVRVFSLKFKLRHPLYDVVKEGNAEYPFYVQPGDYLIIVVHEDGKIEYRMADGSVFRYEKLMNHDVSRQSYYDESQFDADKQNSTFSQYVNRVLQKMDSATAKVVDVAYKNGFSQEERNIAINNVKMQFTLWLFEYTSWKTVSLALSNRNKDAGWQAKPEFDADMEAIADTKNYSFMRRLPVNDKTCMASPYFALVAQRYLYAHVLNHDQYLYFGETEADHARMDSAFVAKDKEITKLPYTSVFKDVALLCRQAQRANVDLSSATPTCEAPLDTSKSIHLKEVEVWSGSRLGTASLLSPNDILNMKLNNAPRGFNILSPVFWALDKFVISKWRKRHPDNKTRAKRITEQYGTEDDLLREAYEQTLQQKK